MNLNFKGNFDNQKKILVTGGAGFIGGCLIRKLLKLSEAKIFNLDKLSYASDLSWLEKEENKNRHRLIKTDLSDAKSTSKAINQIDPDIVFHLAAESHVDRSIDGPEIFIKSNIIGTFNLLNSLKTHYEKLKGERKKNFRIIHISTDEVFGSLPQIGKFSENTPFDPRSPYSASKASSDHLMKAWFHTFNMPILITNCSNNFGPWQFTEKLIPLVISKALKNEKIPVYGDGHNIRDWLFVEDHINALLLVAMKGEIGQNYCIGGFGEKTNLEIINLICEMLDKKLSKSFNHSDLISFVPDRPGHDRRYSIDSFYIKNKLGWAPLNKFETNLEITVNWYLANRDWCNKIEKKSTYYGERLGLEE